MNMSVSETGLTSILDDTALHNRVLGVPERFSAFMQPNCCRVRQELLRKGVTLMVLWQENRTHHPEIQ